MSESNAYIPEGTLVCILLMLPVKSLMRFRSVCKLWYEIISSASFIDAQRKATKDKYLLCTHALISKEEFTNYRRYYFTPGVALSHPPQELYGFRRTWFDGVKVCGSCNGLLCLADESLNPYLDIMLLNPVIRKVKTISKIPVEFRKNEAGGAALCFTYFDEDYKVVRISTTSCRSIYRVGVYSLRTDCWKFTICGNQYNTFDLSKDVPSICVGGVAYFPHSKAKLVCFDLRDERVSELQIPETFSKNYLTTDCGASMQACGESIALMQIRDGYLETWVLKNRDATDNNNRWETKTVTNMRTEAPDYSMESSDVGAYVLRDITGSIGDLYLCGILDITSMVVGFENSNLTKDLKAIDIHTANLVLLNEKTLVTVLEDQEEETKRSMLILYRDLEERIHRLRSLAQIAS